MKAKPILHCQGRSSSCKSYSVDPQALACACIISILMILNIQNSETYHAIPFTCLQLHHVYVCLCITDSIIALLHCCQRLDLGHAVNEMYGFLCT